MKSIALGVIHDVVQPLSALSLYVDALSGEHVAVGIKEDHRTLWARRAKDAIARINRIARSVSSVGKRSADFMPHDVVEDCLALLEQRARAAGIFLETTYQSGAATTSARGERGIACVALLTVTANAIEACSGTNGNHIKIETVIIDSRITIIVENDGPPLTRNPFSDSVTGESPHGMGVGLSTAREALRISCGGDLSLTENSPGCVRFELSFEITRDTSSRVISRTLFD